jgi:hypothetical protein
MVASAWARWSSLDGAAYPDPGEEVEEPLRRDDDARVGARPHCEDGLEQCRRARGGGHLVELPHVRLQLGAEASCAHTCLRQNIDVTDAGSCAMLLKLMYTDAGSCESSHEMTRPASTSAWLPQPVLVHHHPREPDKLEGEACLGSALEGTQRTASS